MAGRLDMKPSTSDTEDPKPLSQSDSAPKRKRPAGKRHSEHGQSTNAPKRTFPKKGDSGLKFVRESAPRPEVDEVQIDPETVDQYRFLPADEKRFTGSRVSTGVHKKLLTRKRQQFDQGAVRAARAQLLHHEDAGFITVDPGESSQHITQSAIARAADLSTAAKRFTLELRQHAPYRISYTNNGRYLLLGGKMGHLAAFEWHSKKLVCENGLNEVVRDVAWLHTDVMYAAAQHKWTYIYDKQGVELHCIKQMHDIRRLQFLPYHFLLVGGSHSSGGFLHWLDVSIGQLVRTTLTKQGPLHAMKQNPSNGVIVAGHSKGTVTMWTPNLPDAAVKIQAHGCAIRDIAVEPTGKILATAGVDALIRLWDLRTYKQLSEIRLPSAASHVCFSQRRVLACAMGNTVHMFDEPLSDTLTSPYLSYAVTEGSVVSDMQFCPFEDVLGIGHQSGFDSIIVPGSGEPQYDWMEANPFEAKSQRREKEIRSLLDKIPADMLTLDTSAIGLVNERRLEETLMARAAALHHKPDNRVQFTPKHKAKGRDKPTHREHRKQTVYERNRREEIADGKKAEHQLADILGKSESEIPHAEQKKTALDRFARKKW